MRKNTSTLIAGILAVFLLSQPAQSGNNGFSVTAAGAIQADGVEFDSMDAYVRSDYFRDNGKRCSARLVPDTYRATARQLRSPVDCSYNLTIIDQEYWPSVVYVIPVWWHVISSSDGLGNLPESVIEAQLEVLNEDFRAKENTLGGAGFDVRIQFQLEGITRTVSDYWFDDNDESGYKSALQKDPDFYFNIYSHSAGGYLGYAYFPQDGGAGSVLDGVVVNWETVGGRNNNIAPVGYDQGRTLVHEVGHYLGLFHTFAGGCANGYDRGDRIADTNAQAEPNYGGCQPVSTCGTLDPINNYMDYSHDVCMTEFTPEQANRAVCSLVNYRPRLYTVQNGGADGAGAIVPPLLTPLLLKQ